MKHKKMIVIITGLLTLNSVRFVDAAMAQFPRNTFDNSIDKIPMNGEYINPESDPKVEERNIKDEFRGINLTPQRYEQIKLARRQFHNGLRQAFKSNIGTILHLLWLPKQEAEASAGKILRNPMAGYSEALTKLLTPEEIKIWQQNAERIKKRNQQGY